MKSWNVASLQIRAGCVGEEIVAGYPTSCYRLKISTNEEHRGVFIESLSEFIEKKIQNI